MVVFACGFPEEAGFILIPYSCSINPLRNWWRSNLPPWSYVISTGYVYPTSNVVSTKFKIVIAFLSLYCIISNHLVTGYIIVMTFNIIDSLPFIHILYPPTRSTHSLFHGIYSAKLAGSLLYCFGPLCTLAHATLHDFLSASVSTKDRKSVVLTLGRLNLEGISHDFIK